MTAKARKVGKETKMAAFLNKQDAKRTLKELKDEGFNAQMKKLIAKGYFVWEIKYF